MTPQESRLWPDLYKRWESALWFCLGVIGFGYFITESLHRIRLVQEPGTDGLFFWGLTFSIAAGGMSLGSLFVMFWREAMKHLRWSKW